MERMSKIKTTYIYDDETDTAELTELEEVGGLENSLLKENKKLKSDLAYERTMLDNVRAEYENLQEVKKKLEEELEKLKTDNIHEEWTL